MNKLKSKEEVDLIRRTVSETLPTIKLESATAIMKFPWVKEKLVITIEADKKTIEFRKDTEVICTRRLPSGKALGGLLLTLASLVPAAAEAAGCASGCRRAGDFWDCYKKCMQV